MNDELLSASSWSSAQHEEEEEELLHRHGDGTATSTITRSQSFDSIPRVSPPQAESITTTTNASATTSSLHPYNNQTEQNTVVTNTNTNTHNNSSNTTNNSNNLESPRHVQSSYHSQSSVESPSQHNTLSKIMSVASSRFSRFTLSRDRDDDSSRAPSPFPEHNTGRKGSRFPGSDHSIISHNTASNNNSNSSNTANNLSNNAGNNVNSIKRIISVSTTPRGTTIPSSGTNTPVNVSTMIPASAVVEAQQKASSDDSDEALLELNQTLLEAIAANDWENYSALCDNDITCIEPDTQGHVLRGIAFHRYFFDKASPELRHDINVLMTNAHVRRLGENSAVICYTRINQRLDSDNKPTVTTCNETRVWQKKEDGFWWNVHFHRS